MRFPSGAVVCGLVAFPVQTTKLSMTVKACGIFVFEPHFCDIIKNYRCINEFYIVSII